ncbi:MAG: hypothetical protein ABI045_04615 [Flavobacteriales bacterium]
MYADQNAGLSIYLDLSRRREIQLLCIPLSHMASALYNDAGIALSGVFIAHI